MLVLSVIPSTFPLHLERRRKRGHNRRRQCHRVLLSRHLNTQGDTSRPRHKSGNPAHSMSQDQGEAVQQDQGSDLNPQPSAAAAAATAGASDLSEEALQSTHDRALDSIRKFLSETTAYSILPESFRLIVLDNELTVKGALGAMTSNGESPFAAQGGLSGSASRLYAAGWSGMAGLFRVSARDRV